MESADEPAEAASALDQTADNVQPMELATAAAADASAVAHPRSGRRYANRVRAACIISVLGPRTTLLLHSYKHTPSQR